VLLLYYEFKKTDHILGKSSPDGTGLLLVIKVSHIGMQVIALVLLELGIVPKQLIETTTEGKQHQCVDKEELYNIDYHATQ